MNTGDNLATGVLNSNATYTKVTAKAAYAVDESGRNVGILITVESLMLTAVTITATDGAEIYRSPVRRLRHSVLDIIPCRAGVKVTVDYLYTNGVINLTYTPKEQAGGSNLPSLGSWTWRYYWGKECPVRIDGEVKRSWRDVRYRGGTFIELPECLPVISWENQDGAAMALAVYPDAAPADEWKPEKSTVRKSYYTPPLLPEEVNYLRTLMMAATGISISDGYAPARLENMTVAANYGDGQQLIKLSFAYELR